MTIHVEVDGKVLLEGKSAEGEMITLRLSPKAAKALKRLCGIVAYSDTTAGRFISAIYKAIPLEVHGDDRKHISYGNILRFLK